MFPGESSASLSTSDEGSYPGAAGGSASPTVVSDSREALRPRLSLDGERKRPSARMAPLRNSDSTEGTFSCSFWAKVWGSSLRGGCGRERRYREKTYKIQRCQIGPGFPPNLATLAAVRCRQGCRIGRETILSVLPDWARIPAQSGNPGCSALPLGLPDWAENNIVSVARLGQNSRPIRPNLATLTKSFSTRLIKMCT